MMDHLDEEEMPEPWMWEFDELLSDHIANVREERKDPNSSRDDDRETPAGSITIRNELAKGRGRNA